MGADLHSSEITFEDAILHLDFAHREPRFEGRIDNRAPAAYAGILFVQGRALLIWGIAGARDIQEMIAHGVCDALDYLLAELPGNMLPRLQVFTRSEGYNEQVAHQIKKLKENKNPDPRWKRFIEMQGLAEVSGKKSDHDSLGILKDLRPTLKKKVQLACDRRIHAEPDQHEYKAENTSLTPFMEMR